MPAIGLIYHALPPLRLQGLTASHDYMDTGISPVATNLSVLFLSPQLLNPSSRPLISAPLRASSWKLTRPVHHAKISSARAPEGASNKPAATSTKLSLPSQNTFAPHLPQKLLVTLSELLYVFMVPQ